MNQLARDLVPPVLLSGCPLSPTLAGIHLDDLGRSVTEADGTELPLQNGQPMPPTLWADDLMLASTTARGLQSLLTQPSDSSNWCVADRQQQQNQGHRLPPTATPGASIVSGMQRAII